MRAISRVILCYPAAFCCLALLLCVSLSFPIAESGINDDWAYFWIARNLANTGHVVYNGWPAAMLGWMLYLGAIFIKVLGFSFTGVRLSVLLVSCGCVVLLHRSLLLIGATQRNALIGTLSIILSPLFLPLAFSFMSDVPSFFAILLCFYGCLRALHCTSQRDAFLWLISSSLLNVFFGTVRQTTWLGALVVVPCAFWILRRFRRAIPLGLIVTSIGAAFILLSMRWLSKQPYVIHETLLTPSSGDPLLWLITLRIKDFIEVFSLVLPVLVGFLMPWPVRSRLGKWTPGLCCLAALLFLGRHKFAAIWLLPFSRNTVTIQGLVYTAQLMGARPIVLSPAFRGIWTMLTFSCLIAFVAACCAIALETRKQASQITEAKGGFISWSSLLILFGPFCAIYATLAFSRTAYFDRYYLPLMFPVAVFAVKAYQRETQRELPIFSGILIVLIASFSVAGTHDLFAETRARNAAAEQLRAAGVPRSEFRGGFDYDGWTELEITGYVNSPRVILPAGYFRPFNPEAKALCRYVQDELTPDIHPRFGLSYSPSACYPLSQFPAINYSTWLGPRQRAIYTLALPPKAD